MHFPLRFLLLFLCKLYHETSSILFSWKYLLIYMIYSLGPMTRHLLINRKHTGRAGKLFFHMRVRPGVRNLLDTSSGKPTSRSAGGLPLIYWGRSSPLMWHHSLCDLTHCPLTPSACSHPSSATTTLVLLRNPPLLSIPLVCVGYSYTAVTPSQQHTGNSHHDRRSMGRGCPTWPHSRRQDLQRPTRGSYFHHLGPFSPSFQNPPRQHHQLGTNTPSRLAHSVSHKAGSLLLCAKPTGFLQRLKSSHQLLPPNADTGVGYFTLATPSHVSIPKNAWSAKTIVGESGFWTSPKFLYNVTPS